MIIIVVWQNILKLNNILIKLIKKNFKLFLKLKTPIIIIIIIIIKIIFFINLIF